MIPVIIVALIVLFCVNALVAYKYREKAKYYERIGKRAILEYEMLSDEFNRFKKIICIVEELQGEDNGKTEHD